MEESFFERRFFGVNIGNCMLDRSLNHRLQRSRHRNLESVGEGSALENLAQDLERNLELIGDGIEAQKTHSILAGVYFTLGREELADTHREKAQP